VLEYGENHNAIHLDLICALLGGYNLKPNIMILTTDVNIKTFLKLELDKNGYQVSAMFSSIFNLPDFLSHDKVNVLILDTDTVGAPPEHLKHMIEKFKISVILLGIKNSVPFAFGGMRGSISKPESDSEFSRRIFARGVLDRIELFTRNTNVAPVLDSSAAVCVNDRIVAIAASTGGTDALHKVLSSLPYNMPPILIVQHMPSGFTYQFAARLNQVSKFTVKEATMNDIVKKNYALIAPGDFHMKAIKRNNKLFVECFMAEKMHGVRPAADILFNSMAEFMGKNVIGVILTGMGSDGARGLQNLKRKGATIIAQDKASSVVYGMPDAAVKLGIVDYELPLDRIADRIASLL
jgi:two-component system chemotaxis response regulator CheB